MYKLLCVVAAALSFASAAQATTCVHTSAEILKAHPDAKARYTERLPDHKGEQCWFDVTHGWRAARAAVALIETAAEPIKAKAVEPVKHIDTPPVTKPVKEIVMYDKPIPTAAETKAWEKKLAANTPIREYHIADLSDEAIYHMYADAYYARLDANKINTARK